MILNRVLEAGKPKIMAMIQLGDHLVQPLVYLKFHKDRLLKKVRVFSQIKNVSLKLWDFLEIFLEDHSKTFHTHLKGR